MQKPAAAAHGVHCSTDAPYSALHFGWDLRKPIRKVCDLLPEKKWFAPPNWGRFAELSFAMRYSEVSGLLSQILLLLNNNGDDKGNNASSRTTG